MSRDTAMALFALSIGVETLLEALSQEPTLSIDYKSIQVGLASREEGGGLVGTLSDEDKKDMISLKSALASLRRALAKELPKPRKKRSGKNRKDQKEVIE